MQLKSTRGVQQEDVHEAADALIAEGLRPTIERVRKKIGRGSPNTVSPMLDTWFATLAGRLGVGGTSEEGGEPPEPVQLAAAMMWEAAMLSARQQAAQEHAQARQALTTERSELELREAELLGQKQAFMARQIALEEALQVARSQLTDLTIRLNETGVLQIRRDHEIDELRKKLMAREKERDADLLRNNDESKRHAEERSRLEARATANERRLLEELDRERQEVKRAKTALVELERRTQVSLTKIEAANTSIAARLQDTERELANARQAFASANERTSELRGLLQAQTETSTATLKQLNLLVVNSVRKPQVRSPIRKRRF